MPSLPGGTFCNASPTQFLHDEAVVIVMDYDAGGTLCDLLEKRKRERRHLEEEELPNIYAQIVFSMYYVHQSQILHHDLKSERWN